MVIVGEKERGRERKGETVSDHKREREGSRKQRRGVGERGRERERVNGR
jgi:hypothetical protein